jgi:hypothetical protein
MKRLIKAKSEYNLINLKVYSEKCIKTSNFIIEEFIRRRRIDYYYIVQWRCCFVKRFTSPLLSGTDTSDRVIQHPKAIIEKYKIDLLNNIFK